MRILSVIFLLFALGFSMPLQAQHRTKGSVEQILQNRGEVYFSFTLPENVNPEKLLAAIGKSISIDHIENSTVYAYANHQGWLRFLDYHLQYHVLEAPSTLLPVGQINGTGLKNSGSWDFYPSYQEYISMMQDFQKNYPQLCELVQIGKSTAGRELLFIHFKPADSLVAKPQVMYTATMHGDETLPFVLMLHLIDYLLKNDQHNQQVSLMLDSLDIWINPLANPDGTYASGDASVSGARRFNANAIDLNRNFPDPDQGDHPDGNAWQVETKAFMDFAARHHFVLSANMHTGSEVANYPWDTWSRRHADDAWWQKVCRQFADTVHYYASDTNYFTDLNNGITDGYDWYHVAGGRQDYMNYFEHCREFTLEMSKVKMPAANTLPDFWEWNYRALLDYLQQALTGIHGQVFDSVSRQPIAAKIFVLDHDTDHSEVYSRLPHGDFYRFLSPGKYNLLVSCENYQPKQLKQVEVKAGEKTVLKIGLVPVKTDVGIQQNQLLKVYPNPTDNFIHIQMEGQVQHWQIVNAMGQVLLQGEKLPHKLNVHHWSSGSYFLRVSGKAIGVSRSFVVR
jgi:hypothetical protein